MLSTIQQERDLKKKASLLKEYLRGEVRLVQLARFLRHEIETSQSKSWTRFCLDVQDWVRKNFEASDCSVSIETEDIVAFGSSESQTPLSCHEEAEASAISILNGSNRWASLDRKSTRLNSSHSQQSRMPSSA